LPTAITTRDFSRVVTLATVGKAAGSIDTIINTNGKVLKDWKRQQRFVKQCELLASSAVWWGVLERNRVKFDPRRFEISGSQKKSSGSGKEHDQANSASKYAASLVPMLLANLSKTEEDTDNIMQVVSSFSKAFGLSGSLAVQRYIEFLLSPPSEPQQRSQGLLSGTKIAKDIRLKLNGLEASVRGLLRCLETPMERSVVLRKCLVAMENSATGKDYERLAVALALYHRELGTLISQDLKRQNIDPRPFILELELIDRRRDALAILSSYFHGERRMDRPLFSSFFLPLLESFTISEDLTISEDPRMPKMVCKILGGKKKTSSTDSFDPLTPLEDILRSKCSSTATSALAPLCLPLGVPRGYIHARSLVERFNVSKSSDVEPPSFEGDVLPVVNRIKKSSDKAELADWCSTQYRFDQVDKLKCLDLALTCAMQASSEAEHFHSRSSSNDAAVDHEAQALDRVKRISCAKDMLSDRLAINEILRSEKGTSERHSGIMKVVADLMKKLDSEVWDKGEFVPEHFIDFFLSESSLLAAKASLDLNYALSMGQFRQFSMLIHRASKSIADKYTHIQVGSFARRLTRRWLFHGDQNSTEKDSVEMEKTPLRETRNPIMPDIEEEDTMNFVMDLTSLRDDDNVWSADIGSGLSSSGPERKLTSEEEPSSLRAIGSAREVSELASRRVALRIAFVMAYSDGYYASRSDGDTSLDENLSSTANIPHAPRNTKTKTRGGLLARLGSRGGSQQNDSVMDHSRELLRIVFAKSSGSDSIDRDLSTSFDSRSIDASSRVQAGKTITFAMRHRALRAASILCPQEALEEVVKDEGYIGVSTPCSLKKCVFGVFVAKEIEEMGLPLPHSDLAQLSTMHYPSYARALWRHHRDGDLRGSKGRLLLLILEMYLKDMVTDNGFVESILSEMTRLNLPRTLLLACECIANYKERNQHDSSLLREGIALAITSVSKTVLAELHKNISGEVSGLDVANGMETVHRLCGVVQSFCGGSDGQRDLEQFIEGLLSLMKAPSQTDLAAMFGVITMEAIRRLEDRESAQRVLDKLLQNLNGEAGLLKLLSPRKQNIEPSSLESSASSDSLSMSLDRFEKSLINV
jgi:hypothetical protein